jgi:cytochrome b6-f complex iron-sulfur subunit
MSCEDCISRRGFLARSAIAAAAVAASACGDGSAGITDPTTSKDVKVSDFPDLAIAGRLAIIDGQRAARRTGTITFAAFSRACTHEGTAINVASGGVTFVCPNHGSRFDADGNVINPPATRNLRSLATSYDPDTDILTIG